MSASSISTPPRKKPPPLEISSPVLTHATGIYSNSSPDRSSLLIELSSPDPSQGPSSFTQDSSTSPISRVPRHSLPDIRLYHNQQDVATKDKEYRAQKMREFESLIDSSKVLRFSLTPDCASP
ncbi:hypothetical protein Unana1_01399 [Umbelopsis nana]